MSFRIVTNVSAIDIKEWEQFVCDHPQGNIFQTSHMYAAYSETKNYQPVVVACYKKNSLTGILLAVIQKEYKGFLGKLSARSIIWGGPLVKNDDICVLEAILKEYDQTIKKQVIYTQIRNIFPMDWAKDHLQKLGYKYEEHLNILIDLNKSEEQLWEKIHPKGKNKIRRAEKESTSFALLTNDNSLENCWPILMEVYKKARLPLPHISLFNEIFYCGKASSPMKIFAALNNGKIIGVMIALCWGNRVIDWYAGGYQQYLNRFPNDLLVWEVIKWSRNNGYKIFDFGGAGKPGVFYGVRDFKLKFGGNLVQYGRYLLVYKKIYFGLGKTALMVYRSLNKK